MKGYVQVYTGNGKGKTTAAFGLALRAAGSGMKIFIMQFFKNGEFCELRAFERYADSITVCLSGSGKLIDGEPADYDKLRFTGGMHTVRKALSSGFYDMVILDEANIAVHYGLLSVEELLGLIDGKPDNVELVITGRYAHPDIIKRADLVTEMKEIKHYYSRGIKARHGIEM